MRNRAGLVFFIILALIGFYTGRTLLPGIFGYRVDAAGLEVPASSQSPTGPVAGTETPPQTGTKPGGGDTGPDVADPGAPQISPEDRSSLWIDVDTGEQQVKIMQGEETVKTMTASTGVEGHETPLGTFQIQNRGEWFFSEKYQQGAKYWVSFKDWGIYLFHSLAMDRDQNVIPEEAEKLGDRASHGCVRLLIEDAKWIYDNIPERAKVVIHE